MISGGLAPIVRGDDTARTLGGLSAMFSGGRSTFNEAHFRNQTIAVLAAAFENARQKQREDISNWQQCPVTQYTLMHGLEHAFRYHATCSVVAGLDETTRAVQRANSPDLKSMREVMEELQALRRALGEEEKPGGTNNQSAPATSTVPEPQTTGSEGEGTGNLNNTPQTNGKAPNPGSKVIANPTAPLCPFDQRVPPPTPDKPPTAGKPKGKVPGRAG